MIVCLCLIAELSVSITCNAFTMFTFDHHTSIRCIKPCMVSHPDCSDFKMLCWRCWLIRWACEYRNDTSLRPNAWNVIVLCVSIKRNRRSWKIIMMLQQDYKFTTCNKLDWIERWGWWRLGRREKAKTQKTKTSFCMSKAPKFPLRFFASFFKLTSL